MAVLIQLRGGTAAEWALANPVLAERELALETDSGLYKIGDGIRAWNALPYGNALDAIVDTMVFSDQPIPAPPAAGTLKMFAKSLAGRMLPRIIGPSGLATPLQPSFFQNFVVVVSPSSSTSAPGTIGNTVTSVGTISHPVPTEQYGYMTNFASAATALATAGTGNQIQLWSRGTIPGGSNGFFIAMRLAFPDASYRSTGTGIGSRIFVGLTDQTMSVSVASDNPAGNFIGFQRLHTDLGRQDANWQLFVKDGVLSSIIDTLLFFTPGDVYDFYLFCAPAGSVVYWRVDDITLGTTREGFFDFNSAGFGGAAVKMRAGFQVQTVDAVIRNVRMNRIYGESDR